MSTMYDALKKAEAENKKAAGIQEKSPVGENFVAEGGIPENIKTAALAIAVLAVFAIVFFRIKGSWEAPRKPAVMQTALQTVNSSQASGPTDASIKPKRAPGTYGLDGVIDAGDNSMAIINGKLLKVDETIDDLILKKISPKEVELLNTKNNSTVILKIE